MSQILHIFRKDLRHHWIEILLCQGALVAFCWYEVKSWHQPSRLLTTREELWSVGFWTGVLLPLSWGLLIFRVVQAETLVGDRQFWITRPYEWKYLLQAKLLFILAFINVPIFIVQAFLLAKAGFPVIPQLIGLVWMQLLLFALPLVPLATLAAVTRNLIQGLVGLLILLLYVVGMAMLSSKLEQGSFSSVDLDWLSGAIAILAVVLALLIQYSRRATWQARSWLAAGAVALTLVEVVGTFLGHGERAYALPPSGQQAFLRAGLDENHPTSNKKTIQKDESVEIRIPFVLWNLPPGSLAHIRGVMLTLEAPDGSRWHSVWDSHYGLLGRRENHWGQDFKIDYSTYLRMKDQPLKANVSLAVDFREQNFREVMSARGEFAVPDVGRCRVDENDTTELRCHSPLLKPGLVVASVDPAASTCPEEPNDDDDKQRKIPKSSVSEIPLSWEWGSDSDLAEYGVSPVQSFDFHFYGSGRSLVCPGTPISFNFPRLSKRTLVEFQANGLKLEDYRPENFTFVLSR